MAVTPVYNWRLPDGPIAANGPQAFSNLATDIENTLSNTGYSDYTPSWTSDGSQQPANPALKIGKYRLANGWCDFAIFMRFGVSTNGGKGRLSLGLPVAASSAMVEQVVKAKLWVPAYGNWDGIGLINAGSSSVMPMWTVATNNTTITFWRNNDDSGAAGTGYPQMAGHWTAENGGNVVITGRYLAA